MKKVAELACLKGRVAVVTGAAGNLGIAISEALCEQGATVAAVDLDESGLDRLSDSVPNVHGIVWDLRKRHAFSDLRDQILESAGTPSVLVNNAAFLGHSDLQGWACEFEGQAPETWDACLDLNLSVPFRLAQIFASDLAGTGHGSIVNISSIHGSLGPDWSLYEGTEMGHPAAYAASKGGLIQITRWLATTLAPRVRVNSISPGGVERGQPIAFAERYNKRTPMGRMASPEDIKGAVAFLASDLSNYVTGQDIVVDGGYSIW